MKNSLDLVSVFSKLISLFEQKAPQEAVLKEIQNIKTFLEKVHGIQIDN